MKRLLLILLLNGFFLFLLNAQHARFEVGIEGGPGFSTLYGNEPMRDYTQMIFAGFGGASFQYHFSNHFSLRTGLRYERKGTHVNINNWDFQSDYLYHFNYLTLPVVVQAEFGKKVRFYINAGPYFSYLLSQKYVRQAKDLPPDHGQGLLIGASSLRNTVNYDAGLSTEIGVRIAFSEKTGMSLGVAEHFGLVNTKKSPLYTTTTWAPVYTIADSFNNALSFVIGFSYKIGS